MKFPLGLILETANAKATLGPEEVLVAIRRHREGDWGDVPPEDREANELALKNGDRLFSVYPTSNGKKFYVITEWDRSVTTVLMPEDY